MFYLVIDWASPPSLFFSPLEPTDSLLCSMFCIIIILPELPPMSHPHYTGAWNFPFKVFPGHGAILLPLNNLDSTSTTRRETAQYYATVGMVVLGSYATCYFSSKHVASYCCRSCLTMLQTSFNMNLSLSWSCRECGSGVHCLLVFLWRLYLLLPGLFWSSFQESLGSWVTLVTNFLTVCFEMCVVGWYNGVMFPSLVDNGPNSANKRELRNLLATSAIAMELNNVVAKVLGKLFATPHHEMFFVFFCVTAW